MKGIAMPTATLKINYEDKRESPRFSAGRCQTISNAWGGQLLTRESMITIDGGEWPIPERAGTGLSVPSHRIADALRDAGYRAIGGCVMASLSPDGTTIDVERI